ncbi:haloalkane dehalogenase [Hoeflea prorocentri]|uniref:Haloalkane dehalogenase n=1 Tax=Hoeflea prorocentri TaxID=1922333 RepID=A0A9X3ZG92_9HYPH|nr:haloalkane dehalogenase [Hoeflea prorocentri]MCY6380532.1 haloalkane dehalogenase [Hoeflea prorocentri]MDA5398332.1 haloalkane dehalogenase [Hoeflea prorocentri]
MAHEKVLRTPEERFADLPDYPFQPHYETVDGGEYGPLRMHYVDEGPKDGPVVLLLHGEPTWSFLYRKMIPPITAAGMRVVAPDFIGFGKSDKIAERGAYSYLAHVNWMKAFIDRLGLKAITYFGQDWGGLIGLRLVAEAPDLFARVMIGNTGLPTGDQDLGEAFKQWREYSQTTPTFNIGGIVSRGTARGMDEAVAAAYDAPYPSEEYKAGARAFPMLVPASPDDPATAAQRAAWESLRRFEKPFLTCFSDKDMIMRGGEKVFKKLIPGAAGENHFITENAGHFLQEDAGPLLAEKLVSFARKE